MRQKGIIYKSTGSWYTIKSEDHIWYQGRLRGIFKTLDLKITNPIAVGDVVEFEIEDNEQKTVTIENILPRENYIIRKSAHKRNHGHLIASNLSQSILVATIKQPKTSIGFIDRFLISCEAFRIPAVIVFNKSDLFDEEDLEEFAYLKDVYEPLGYTIIKCSTLTGEGIEALRALLDNKTSLFSGHSGVGKSSIINLLMPHLSIKTGEVSTHSNKGTHTTTFAEMHDYNSNACIIDTPGIKELGLFEMENTEIAHYFPEMRKRMNECKFNNCKHLNEPGCAIKKAVEDSFIAPTRYESYISILNEEDTHR
jgi:ribosome biogenesis GTPase